MKLKEELFLGVEVSTCEFVSLSSFSIGISSIVDNSLFVELKLATSLNAKALESEGCVSEVELSSFLLSPPLEEGLSFLMFELE
jgi:hypothetical protein